MGILQSQYFDGQYSNLLFMNICPSFLYLLLIIYVLIFSIYTYILLSFKHILITHNSVKLQNISFSTFFVCYFFPGYCLILFGFSFFPAQNVFYFHNIFFSFKISFLFSFVVFLKTFKVEIFQKKFIIVNI